MHKNIKKRGAKIGKKALKKKHQKTSKKGKKWQKNEKKMKLKKQNTPKIAIFWGQTPQKLYNLQIKTF